MSSPSRPDAAPAEPGADAAVEETAVPAETNAPGTLPPEVPVSEPLTVEQAPAGEPVPPPEEPRLRVVPDVEVLPPEPSVRATPKPSVAIQPPAIDAFGLDVAFEQRAIDRLKPVYEKWFRVTTEGLEHVPERGAAIVVGNHAGALPWDITMLKCAVAFDHPSHRRIRPLVEDALFHLPFVGVAANRFGAVRAHPENALALLEAGEAIAVFPEGEKGIRKAFARRYKLQRFGRGGFVRLAMKTGAPIVPVAIVGSEEAQPLLGRGRPFGLKIPPIAMVPFLGAAGLLPLPSKWTISFLPPVRVDGDPNDELLVQRRTEDVRSAIQARLDELVRARKTPFT